MVKQLLVGYIEIRSGVPVQGNVYRRIALYQRQQAVTVSTVFLSKAVREGGHSLGLANFAVG